DQLNVVKLLIQNGAHVNEKGMNGETPLHYAADNVNTSIAGLLLSNKADLNARNIYAVTPLHSAIKQNIETYSTDEDKLVKLSKLFIQHGADVNARDRN
ncbi:hypothetical protein CAPTEDRAFT_60358, partial [Capitella teleta]